MISLGFGCTRGRAGPPADAARDFGPLDHVPRVSNADARAYLTMARAILDHRGRAAVAPPPPATGRRVFLALWPGLGSGNSAGTPDVATASAATLADAVAAAADAIAARGPDAGQARLELDIATSVDGVTLDEDFEVPIATVGLEGVLVVRDDGKVGAVLPGEVVERAMFRAGSPPRLDHQKMRPALAVRAGLGEPDLAGMRAYRFRADGYVESVGKDQALSVTRGMVEHPPQATPELLVAAVGHGADYLARVLNDQGRYSYMVHPVDDRDDASYGWLRHAGVR